MGRCLGVYVTWLIDPRNDLKNNMCRDGYISWRQVVVLSAPTETTGRKYQHIK